ncbi:MAG: hypothetical protein LBU15_02620 [Rickettsiales bacterium]|jgi:hypothetical protein|nr:hypothetical protein [Rickettsiales bacterium]
MRANNRLRFLLVFLSIPGLSAGGRETSGFDPETIDWREEDYEQASEEMVDRIIKESWRLANEFREGRRPDIWRNMNRCEEKGSEFAIQRKPTEKEGYGYEGMVKSDGVRSGWGRMVYHCGTVHEVCWKNGQEDGPGILVKTNPRGNFSPISIYAGTWKDGREDGKGLMIMYGALKLHNFEDGIMKEASRLSLLYDRDGNPIVNSNRGRAVLKTVKFMNSGLSSESIHYDLDGGRPVTIRYGAINRLLNGGKVKKLDDLIEKGAITGITRFSELKRYAKWFMEDVFFGAGLLQGKRGIRAPVPSEYGVYLGDVMFSLTTDESHFLLLASLDSVEKLKRIRFTLAGTVARENAADQESYSDIGCFLKNSGIDVASTAKMPENLALMVNRRGVSHSVGVVVAMDKIAHRLEKAGFGAITNITRGEEPFYVYDSYRTVENDDYRYFFGDLSDGVNFLNSNSQRKEFGSCIIHAIGAVSTAASRPDLVRNIVRGRTRPYGFREVNGYGGRPNEAFNEFELETMLALQRMFDSLDLGQSVKWNVNWLNVKKIEDLKEPPMLVTRNVLANLVSDADRATIEYMCRESWWWRFRRITRLACSLDEKLSYEENTIVPSIIHR